MWPAGGPRQGGGRGHGPFVPAAAGPEAVLTNGTHGLRDRTCHCDGSQIEGPQEVVFLVKTQKATW